MASRKPKMKHNSSEEVKELKNELARHNRMVIDTASQIHDILEDSLWVITRRCPCFPKSSWPPYSRLTNSRQIMASNAIYAQKGTCDVEQRHSPPNGYL